MVRSWAKRLANCHEQADPKDPVFTCWADKAGGDCRHACYYQIYGWFYHANRFDLMSLPRR